MTETGACPPSALPTRGDTARRPPRPAAPEAPEAKPTSASVRCGPPVTCTRPAHHPSDPDGTPRSGDPEAR
ncbi:hypothetical protein [Actinophytocola sp. KF-1]